MFWLASAGAGSLMIAAYFLVNAFGRPFGLIGFGSLFLFIGLFIYTIQITSFTFSSKEFVIHYRFFKTVWPSTEITFIGDLGFRAGQYDYTLIGLSNQAEFAAVLSQVVALGWAPKSKVYLDDTSGRS